MIKLSQSCFISIIMLVTVVSQWSCVANRAEEPVHFLFAIADDASYPHMGAYGTNWVRTPAFDRIAREGILFMNAYTPNAKCAPSRACILTGRYSWQLEEAANHQPYFPEKFKTFPEVLEENGYHVGFTGKGWAPGIAKKNGQDRFLIGKPWQDKKTEPQASHISNTDYAENFRSFLDQREEEKPFFFWYGGFEPHRAYEYGAGLKYGSKKLSDIDRVPSFYPDVDTVRTDLLDYAFELEYFDLQLGKMLDILEEKKLLKNTVIIATSDNGMPFPRVKGQMYEASNHLPLAIMWPEGIYKPGRTENAFVSFIDLSPTILELAGIPSNRSGMQTITGSSLVALFRPPGIGFNIRDYTLFGKERHDVGRPGDAGYPIRGIIRDQFLYLENFAPDRWPAGNPETGYLNCDGSPIKTYILNHQREEINRIYWEQNFGKRPARELYHLLQDPDNVHNLIGTDSKLDSIATVLQQFMYEELRKQGDPRMLGHGQIFDQYPVAAETAGFYERYMSGEKINTPWVNDGDFQSIED